jgi:predicted DNA-binding transcriptional regulator YafY
MDSPTVLTAAALVARGLSRSTAYRMLRANAAALVSVDVVGGNGARQRAMAIVLPAMAMVTA